MSLRPVAFNPLVTILKLRESIHASRAISLGLIVQLRAEISQLCHLRPGVVEGVETPPGSCLRVVGSLRLPFAPPK